MTATISTISDQLQSRSQEQEAERRHLALRRYRELLTQALAGPLAAEQLDELAGLVTALGLPPHQPDRDAKCLRTMAVWEAEEQRLGALAQAARKKLDAVRKEEALARQALADVLARRGEIDKACNAFDAIKRKARGVRLSRENEHLFPRDDE